MRRDIVENEEARLNALRNLGLLNTPPSESFDRITRIAGRLLGAPVSTISLTDRDRQWFKSRFGVDLAEIPRAEAPCNYAIRSDEVFVVPDLREDPRFASSLLAGAGIRFYAGAPLITRDGYGLGTLCVIDDKPRTISDDDKGLLRDLAAMVMTQVEIQNMIGRIDPTSGLPNEHQMFEDLEDLGGRASGMARTGLLVELVPSRRVDHGMRVLGADYAEELVRNVTGTIRAAIGEGPALYHVGGTRYLTIIDEEAGASWRAIADRIATGLREPVLCSGIPISPDPVMGVYEFRAGEVTARDVLRRLFGAADDARETGRPVSGYNEIRDRAQARTFTLLNDIRDAIGRPDELQLVYQPRVDLASGACVGYEALLRWQHPTLGNVEPGEFIPLVEETAFMGPLTDWVVRRALRDAAAWGGDGVRRIVSINVSAKNLDEDDFAVRLAAILAGQGIDTAMIELEFTESALARDNARTLRQLSELNDIGVRIAIDDFGTGYSSLSYLQRLPVSILKIDRSFIQSLATRGHDQKLVRAVIDMAHDLGYRVVAEGVETVEACDLLAAWKCDEAQGYFIARPMAPAAIAGWLDARDNGAAGAQQVA